MLLGAAPKPNENKTGRQQGITPGCVRQILSLNPCPGKIASFYDQKGPETCGLQDLYDPTGSPTRGWWTVSLAWESGKDLVVFSGPWPWEVGIPSPHLPGLRVIHISSGYSQQALRPSDRSSCIPSSAAPSSKCLYCGHCCPHLHLEARVCLMWFQRGLVPVVMGVSRGSEGGG